MVRMQIIYLHGFQSSPMSKKGQQLEQYCTNVEHADVHLPDLNKPPEHVLRDVSKLIESLPLDQVRLVGSSLGDSMRHILSQNMDALLY
jgi:predicted esterase YcpF (UPF0227 family)